MKDLTKGKPIRLILLFAVPLFVGQLFQLFYSLADTRIVGQTLGDEALAAVGATTTLSDMLLSFLNGLTNGFAIVIATCFGAKDESQMKKAMGGTILLGSCCAVALSGLCPEYEWTVKTPEYFTGAFCSSEGIYRDRHSRASCSNSL